MTTCQKTPDGKHAWVKIGRCHHTDPSARAGNGFDCYECSSCGRVAHSGPRSFACGMLKRTPEGWQKIVDAERAKCPIWERLEAQKAVSAS